MKERTEDEFLRFSFEGCGEIFIASHIKIEADMPKIDIRHRGEDTYPSFIPMDEGQSGVARITVHHLYLDSWLQSAVCALENYIPRFWRTQLGFPITQRITIRYPLFREQVEGNVTLTWIDWNTNQLQMRLMEVLQVGYTEPATPVVPIEDGEWVERSKKELHDGEEEKSFEEKAQEEGFGKKEIEDL